MGLAFMAGPFLLDTDGCDRAPWIRWQRGMGDRSSRRAQAWITGLVGLQMSRLWLRDPGADGRSQAMSEHHTIVPSTGSI